jgi:hypothetical protein
MCHPNPYLFQIKRLDCMLVAKWIFQQAIVRTRCRMSEISRMYFLHFGLVVEYICLYERSLLYRLFIQCIIVVNINVSNIKLMHMLNFLGTFSIGVT